MNPNTIQVAGALGSTSVADSPYAAPKVQNAPAAQSYGNTAGATATPTANATPAQIQAGQVYLNTQGYTPVQAGGAASSSPVVTSKSAQDDYNAKYAAFQNTQAAVMAAQNAQQRQTAVDQQNKAMKDYQDAQLKMQQQGMDMKQAEITAKNAALGLASGGSTRPATGNPPAGWDKQTYDNFKAANPNLEPNAEDTQRMQSAGNGTPANSIPSAQQTALNNEQAQLQQIQAQRDQVTNQQISQLNSIQNGTIPLTSAQSSIIGSLQTQLQQNTQYQQQANSSYTGAVTEAMARSGGEYTPQQSAAVINNAVSNGVSKIQALDNTAATTIATLEQQFQKQNYDEVNAGYDMLQKQLDNKASAITTMYSQTTAALKDQRDYALEVQKFQETTIKDTAQLKQSDIEFRDAHDAFGNVIGTAIYSKSSGRLLGSDGGQNAQQGSQSGGVPTVQIQADGTPDPATQEAFLQTLPQPFQQLVKNIANYQQSSSGLSPKTKSQIDAWAAQYDPTYNAANYASRASYIKSLTSNSAGSIGSAINSANKSINHLTAFVNSLNELPQTGRQSSIINKLDDFTTLNQDTRQTLAAAQTEGLGVADELSKFFKGTGSTNESEINAWKQQLNVHGSPADIKGLTQGAITLLAGQLETLSEQYKNTMGKPPTSNLLGPSAISNLSNLKNQGYQVDIPGIYFTSKEAFQKYGGGTQEQWNGAVDALTKAGIPLTDENIAQWAQMN